MAHVLVFQCFRVSILLEGSWKGSSSCGMFQDVVGPGTHHSEDSHGGKWSDWVSKARYGRSLSRRTGGLFIYTYGSRWPSGATSFDSRTTSRHSEISGERPHTAVSDVCGPTERHASLRLCASEEITTLFGPSDGRLGENRFP